MTMHSSDAELVAGHLAGDPGALAGIYDRYSDSLHDTAAAMLNDRSEAADVLHDVILIAAERLGQLRDPDRLKPWLFAILRNEVYRRSKKRRRTIATDFSGAGDGYDMADDRDLDPGVDVTESAAGDDLAELVRNAARGLDERDQLVLELSVRQGLGGQDLADALGVTANQSYTLVHRMRERVERSLTAYVVAKAGRQDCDDLDRLLAKWDGEFTTLVRKRVARHVEACEVCDTRRSKVAPLVLFAGAPVYAAPASLRDRILSGATASTPAPSTPYAFTATDGFPQVVRAARRVAAWVAPTAAACLLLLAAGTGVALIDRGDGDAVRDEAFVATSDDLATTVTTTTTTTTATTTIAPSTTSGATNDAVPAISSTEATTAPDTVVATVEEPTTTAGTTAPSPTDASPGPAPTVRPTSPPNTSRPTTAPTAPPTTPVTSTLVPVTTAPTTVAPVPGRLEFGGTSIGLGTGSGASSGSVPLSNPGQLPVTYSVSGITGPFSVSPQSGVLNGGESTSITASIDRTGLREGSGPSGSFTISGSDGSSATIAMSAQVDRSPVISGASASGFCNQAPTGATSVGISASAGIFDESNVSANLSVSGPRGQSAGGSLSRDGGTWYGSTNVAYPPNEPATVSGTWSWSIVATDARGNNASASGTFNVSC